MNTPIRIATLEDAIAAAANVTVENMRSHNRERQYADARHAVWFIARDYLGFSYKELSRIYLRDHTTIIHGAKKMRESKLAERIVEGVKKVCPDVLDKPGPGEARTVENWRF